jgi:hypothetical protein
MTRAHWQAILASLNHKQQAHMLAALRHRSTAVLARQPHGSRRPRLTSTRAMPANTALADTSPDGAFKRQASVWRDRVEAGTRFEPEGALRQGYACNVANAASRSHTKPLTLVHAHCSWTLSSLRLTGLPLGMPHFSGAVPEGEPWSTPLPADTSLNHCQSHSNATSHYSACRGWRM